MKLFIKVIKRLVIGLFSIYAFNTLFLNLNITIPFNLYTICISSFLGIFGLIGLIILQFYI